MTIAAHLGPSDLATLEEIDARALAEMTRIDAYERASLAPATLARYAVAFADFQDFGQTRDLLTLPAAPETVARYCAHLADAGRTYATIRVATAAIRRAHAAGGHPQPGEEQRVRSVLSGIARKIGTAPRRRKAALTRDDLRRTIAAIVGDDLRATRDRALILLGFATAMRRAELAALDVEDIRFEERGAIVRVRRSKTDQQQAGDEIGVPVLKSSEVCAVRAVTAWMEKAELTSGPLFRAFALPRGRMSAAELSDHRLGGRDVARILQRALAYAEIDGDYAAHSLRAGFVTAGVTRGISEAQLMRVTRHKSLTTFRGYARRATVLDDAPLREML